jgi:hypothetical protein
MGLVDGHVGGDGLLRLGRYGRLGRESGNGLRSRRRVGVLMVVVVVMIVVAMIMVVMIVVVMLVAVIVMIMVVRMMIVIVTMLVVLMTFERVMMPGVGVQLLALGRDAFAVLRRHLALDRMGGGIRANLEPFDDLALDALAMAAAARIAMARAPAVVGAILVLLLGLAMGLLVGLDQRLPIGDGDLVIVGMDFAEGEEAVAVAAIFDEGGLERGFDPRDLGEVDIPAQLLALRGLEIKFFDAIAADHDDPGLFRVGRIDQHLVRHIVTLGGGGR